MRQDVSYELTCWIDAAKRGLYAYDWIWGLGRFEDDKPYRLIASPDRPVIFSELPSEIQEYLLPIRFTEINFAETDEFFTETNLPENNS